MPDINESEERTRQFNVQLRPGQQELLLYYARATDSIASSGPTKGEYSIGALIRRISEGEISIVYKSKRIMVPPFRINQS